jgi:glycosyltransferase involved in cell wall biosynthesis
MRILMVDNSPQMGSSIRCAASLLRDLAENGHEVGLSASRPDLWAPLLGDKVRVYPVAWIGFRNVFDAEHHLTGGGLPVVGQWLAVRRFSARLLPEMRRITRLFRPDVAALNNMNLAQIPALIAAQEAGAAVVAHGRAIRLFGKRELTPFARRARRVICMSDAVRRCLAERLPSLNDKLVVVFDGLEDEMFRVAPDPGLRDALGLPHDAPVACLLGRLTARKGQHVAIAAWPKVREMAPRAVLAIVGAGDATYLEWCKHRAAELGVGDAVRFLGHRDDAPQVLAACDLLLHASCYADPHDGMVEAFGRVVIEAMAVRRPVVATAAGGVPELIENGVVGWLIRPNDPDDLADKVGAALADPELRRRAGEAGRARAEALFTQRAATTRMMEEYQRAMK